MSMPQADSLFGRKEYLAEYEHIFIEPKRRHGIGGRVVKDVYELDPITMETGDEPDTGKLEILPGGLIAQPLTEDPATYNWASRQWSKLKVRIVNFEQFRSITGQEPPTPPQLPRDPRLPRRDERNPGGTDSILASNAEHQFKNQPTADELGTSSTPSRSGSSILPGKCGTMKANEGGRLGGLQNPTVIHPVPDKALKKPVTSHPPRRVFSVTNNDTTGHNPSTKESSGGSRPKPPASDGTSGTRKVSLSKSRRGNRKAETTSESSNCCICM